MRKKKPDSLNAKIKRCIEAIGKQRDIIRELIVEATENMEASDDAIESLEYAADRLSENV